MVREPSASWGVGGCGTIQAAKDVTHMHVHVPTLVADIGKGRMRSSGPQGQVDLGNILQALLAQDPSDGPTGSGTLHDAIPGVDSAMRLLEPSTSEQGYIQGETLHPHAFALNLVNIRRS